MEQVFPFCRNMAAARLLSLQRSRYALPGCAPEAIWPPKIPSLQIHHVPADPGADGAEVARSPARRRH